MNPLLVALTFLTSTIVIAAGVLNRRGIVEPRATYQVCAGCVLLVTAVDAVVLVPLRVLVAVVFYAGIFVLAGLLALVATMPIWMDRVEADDVRRLVDRANRKAER